MIVHEHRKLPFVSLNIIRAASLEKTWKGVISCGRTVAGETRNLQRSGSAHCGRLCLPAAAAVDCGCERKWTGGLSTQMQ